MSAVHHLYFLLAAITLAGCVSIPSPEARLALANELASRQGWQLEQIAAEQFKLITYIPQHFLQAEILTVYIEGDGFAWIDSTTPSPDPTPQQPLGLKLALAQPSGNVAYLARPCQFLDKMGVTQCGRAYWTNKRFAPEVIAATHAALDVLKTRFGARQLKLVGYSGGGAVAALVAASRGDVALLVTVAGNLETEDWAQRHHISPLSGSLNPAGVRIQLMRIRQVHFSGELDQIVPPVIANTFAFGFPIHLRPEIRILKDFDHSCCWVKNWATLWNSIH